MVTLSFEPLIPLALWLTLLMAGAGLLTWYGWRRPAAVSRRLWAGILALMATGHVLVLIVLLNPTWVEPVTPPAGKPLLHVLVDATASMATPDAAAGQTRYQAAAQLAQAFARDLAERYEVRLATFAAAPTPADPENLEPARPQGPVTDLAAALTGSLEEGRPQGQALVLLSDGIHNGGGGATRVLEAARLAKALACPVYARTFGGEAVVKDLAIELQATQELAYVGQRVPVTVVLRQRGLAGGLVSLALVHEDKEIERQQVTLSPAERREVRFHVQQEKPGLYRYELQAAPLPGEVSLVNNTATLLLRVVDEPIRVLLLEGKPYWDAKFLVRTLLLDASVEVDSLVRVSDSRLHRRRLKREKPKASSGSAEPGLREEWKIITNFEELLAGAEDLRAYQVLVLGRDAESFLTDGVLGQLRTWVLSDGGCLVCYRGQPVSQVSQRLGQLLPVRWSPGRESRFRVSLTERGRDLNWFTGASDPLAQLPTLATTSRAEQPRPLAVVLATAQGADQESPAVAYQPYGSGRVVVIEGAGMWRWAFLPPSQQQHDDVYRSLWHGLLRWLASGADLLPGQTLALRSDKVRFGTTESATATLLLREEALKAQVPIVELRGGGLASPQAIAPVPAGEEPGTYRVVFGKLAEGRYVARVAGSEQESAGTAAFDVRSLFEEELDLKARPDLMARIARESGGAVLEGDTPGQVVEQFRREVASSRPQRVRRLSAWDRWWVLLGVVGVWGAAWAIRRASGLI